MFNPCSFVIVLVLLLVLGGGRSIASTSTSTIAEGGWRGAATERRGYSAGTFAPRLTR